MARRTVFNPLWVEDPLFEPWLERVEGEQSSGYCKLCRCSVHLSNMGKRALIKHTETKKHRTVVSSMKTSSLSTWVQKIAPASSHDPKKTTDVPNPPQQQTSVDKFLIKDEVSRAEIYHALDCVTSHLSYNSRKHSSALFSVMFPDSDIAQNFSCGPTKLSYSAVFGLAPYFQDELHRRLDKVKIYSISFDESFNSYSKNEQMDLIVRYFDEDKELVVNRYLGSEFLGHTTAKDLLEKFEKGVSKLDGAKMIQVGMDGPNSNLKFLRDLVSKRELEMPDAPSLLDIGTCGLHVVHGAFRTGINATDWKLDSILRSLYYLFNESPARRSDYSESTNCSVFPLYFCGTRWLEDVRVAERALLIWDNICKYVNHLSSGKKSKIPKCASYNVVKKAVSDPTTKSKLHVFIYVAKIMTPFLKQFQSDSPLAPFIDEELGIILKSLMENFMKSSSMGSSRYASDLAKKDFEDESNHIQKSKVNGGFACSDSLRACELSEEKMKEFKSNLLECYLAIVRKLINRSTSPCKIELVSQLSALNPRYIMAHPNKTVEKFEMLLSALVKSKHREQMECQDILDQYKKFVALCRLEHRERFENFKLLGTERLDALYCSIIGNNPDFCELWQVMKMMFVLSHGQSFVERGFSVNKDTLEVNMQERTLVAHRMICDGVAASLNNEEGPRDISKLKISEKMISYFRNAKRKYNNFSEEKKIEAKASNLETEKSSLKNDIKKERAGKDVLQKKIERFSKEADNLAQQAESQRKFSLIEESNEMRKRCRECQEELEEREKKIAKLEDHLSRL